MNLLWLFLLSATPVARSHLTSDYFPGYGFAWYDPNCGFSCYNAVSSTRLSCPTADTAAGHSMGMDMDMDTGAPTPGCRAQSLPFLETIAYCMSTRCGTDVPVWKREEFWATKLISGVVPKWTYSETLAQLGNSTPTMVYNASSTEVMTMPMTISDSDYNKQFNFNRLFDHIEMLQARYAIVLVVLGIGIPILCSQIRKLPFATGLLDKLKPYLVYPSTVGSYQVRPLPWLIGNAPTVGQAVYIFFFFALNVIIGYRTGHIGYALLPLVVLFSTRNNFLLWVTNWSYGTYLLLHRWIARIFAVQAIVHSITLLLTYQGSGSYPVESVKPYWLWGIVATVLTCAMLILSLLYFRRIAYEVFLIVHIILAVFVIVGCWYHVILRWGYNFYDNWLYAAIAVWFFDRAVRVLRVLKNGMRYADVTEVGDGYVRVDIPGVRWAAKPGCVGYVGFPTLHTLRPWENHPFSINSTALFRRILDGPYPHSAGTDALEADHLLLLGGGIGITGLLSWLSVHPSIKLAWSVKTSDKALVDEMYPIIRNVADKQILVGQRFSIKDLLQDEIHVGYKKVGVIVCGPPEMCDEARALVAGLGRGSKTVFELHVDAFTW